MKFNITLGYDSKLNISETVIGVDQIKTGLFKNIKSKFDLIGVESGLITEKVLWLNDDFQLTERPIDFDTKENNYGEILQSNNKWRRYFLYKTGISEQGEGIISNFKTVRRDTDVDNLNSLVYEETGIEIVSKKISRDELNDFITNLYEAICEIDKNVSSEYKVLDNSHFPETITFITYKQLKILYPFLSYQERIDKFSKENGSFVLTNFVEKLLGQKTNSPYSEDVFNFKYYSKLFVYNRSVERAVSIAYVSYQVDREVLKEQNIILKENWKNNTEYNHLIKSSVLPLTISAGINVNRICMAILEKQHIGEVHSSIWDEEFLDYCEKNGIVLL